MLVLRTSKRRLRRARTLGRCRGRHPLVVEYRGIGFRIGTCGREALTDLVERIGGSNTLLIGRDLAGVGFVDLVFDIDPLLPCLFDLVGNNFAMAFGTVDLLAGRTLLDL